jgi:eukaryotic-like serine/threonine-protein kinase
VMKCLEKDRNRRYETANALAMDIVRHLTHEPVTARPPSRLYEFGKSVRRHSFGFAATGVALVTLSAGLLLTTLAANRAKRAEHVQAGLRATASQLQLQAQQEAQRARAAESNALEMLRDSYLAQAQAGRWSRHAGRRFSGLELLRKAAEIRPGLDLRNEAIACLALPDLSLVREWQAYTGERVFNFDPSYRLYASADLAGTVHICRVADGSELMQFSGYEPRFQRLGFSPDSRLLYVGHGATNSFLELLDLASRSSYLRLDEPRFRAIAFTADSRLAAVSFERREAAFPVRIYDLKSKSELASFAHQSSAAFFRFHPKQTNLLLTSDMSSLVRLWDWEKGRVVKTFLHPDWVSECDWDPEGRRFATACADQKLRLWDLESEGDPALLVGHEWAAINVSFSQDGAFVASRGWDGLLKVWDSHTCRELVSKPVTGFSYPFGAENRLAACTGEGTFSLFEMTFSDGYRVIHGQANPRDAVTSCDYSPDGKWLLTADGTGLSLWDLELGKEVQRVANPDDDLFARFHPDGVGVFAGSSKGVQQFQLESSGSGRGPSLAPRGALGSALAGSPLFVSANGCLIATPAEVISVPSTTTPVEPHRSAASVPRRAAPAGLVWGGLSPDGKLVAAFTRGGTTNVEIHEVATGKVVAKLPARPSVFGCFSPDNHWFATGDHVEVRIWNTATWQSVGSVPREAASHYGFMSFTADSRVLAAASSPSQVILLEVAACRELARLEPPERQNIHWITFNPQGTQLAVAAGKGSIHIWDLPVIRRRLAALKLDWELHPWAEPEGQ